MNYIHVYQIGFIVLMALVGISQWLHLRGKRK